jgi:hypothetical protein
MYEKINLTLWIEVELVDAAKNYAAIHHTTVSRLVDAYLRKLTQADAKAADTPILHRLTGILPSDVSVEGYHTYRLDKYGS